MTPLFASTLFMLAVFVLCLLRPHQGRWFVGFFFLAMGSGVNLGFTLFAPEMFVALGTADPIVPVFERLFATVVGAAPAAWGTLAVLFETTVGMLLLQRGMAARWGLVGAIGFLLAITPLGPWTQANPVLAVALTTLWFRGLDVAFVDAVRGGRRAGPRGASNAG